MSDKQPIYNHFFGNLPQTLPPERKIRRWDMAIGGGIAIAFTVSAYTLALIWRDFPVFGSMMDIPFKDIFKGGFKLLINAATKGKFYEDYRIAWDAFMSNIPFVTVYGRLLVAGGLGAALGSLYTFDKLRKPASQFIKATGDEMLEGDGAEKAARAMTDKKDIYMYLHPDLGLPKTEWTKHTLIYGSVGAGKTQVLLGILQQIFEKDAKMLLYDVKGDFTSYFFDKVVLISPWDVRSSVWDISSDIDTDSSIQTFASSLFPGDEKNKFFNDGATAIMVAVIRRLYQEKGKKWCWKELATLCALDRKGLHEIMKVTYPSAATIIADGQSQATSSVLATFSNGARIVQQLATAWPNRVRRVKTPDGVKKIQPISFKQWIQDDYKGKKQIIIQGGTDKDLQAGYISGIINALVPNLINPSFKDNERGRSIFFIFDEFPTMGKLEFERLVSLGRSKGLQVILGFQDLEQIKKVYGSELANALSAMVSNHIVGKLQLGETRQQLVKYLGTRKVYYTKTNYSNSGGQMTASSSFEHAEINIVEENELGLLGVKRVKKSKKYPHGFYNDLLVVTKGKVLKLNFPGISIKAEFEPLIEAKWCSSKAGVNGESLVNAADVPVISTAPEKPKVPLTPEEQKKHQEAARIKSAEEAKVRREKFLAQVDQKKSAFPNRLEPKSTTLVRPGISGTDLQAIMRDTQKGMEFADRRKTTKASERMAEVLNQVEVNHQKEHWGMEVEQSSRELQRTEAASVPPLKEVKPQDATSQEAIPKTAKVNVIYQPKNQESGAEESPLSEAATHSMATSLAGAVAPGSEHLVSTLLHAGSLLDSVSASQPEPKKDPIIIQE